MPCTGGSWHELCGLGISRAPGEAGDAAMGVYGELLNWWTDQELTAISLESRCLVQLLAVPGEHGLPSKIPGMSSLHGISLCLPRKVQSYPAEDEDGQTPP